MSEQDAASVAAFAAAFPQPDDAAWRRLVDKALKGAPFERLISRTADGVEIQPLYPRATGAAPLARAGQGPWRALARLDHPDSAQAAEQAGEDLAGGAHGLHLVFEGAVSAHGFGLSTAPGALEDALGRDLAGVSLALDLGDDPAVASRVAQIIEAQGLDPASADVAFGLRPSHPDFARRVATLAERGFAAPLCVADARAVHAAGGSEAQELAVALAEGVAALRALEAAGMPLERARDALAFRLAVDADQFASMCKLRALRRAWARIEQACGLAPKPLRLHAETAWRMTTRRDPWVNVLRAATAAFAAGVAGADALTVLPHTQALGLPDAFARRLARNLQLVLIEEAHLGHVADPAAGAGGFEALTDDFAARAWTLFQGVERAGGVEAALAGELGAAIAAVRDARLRDVARRKAPLTGVSEFPDLAAAAPFVLAPAPALSRAGPLAPMRLAEPFERLRDLADADAVRPAVFLAALGPLVASAARVGFARGFFQSGGFETPASPPLTDAEACAAAFVASGAPVACLCGADAEYETMATDCARALKAAGASKVLLAGRPGAHEEAWRAAGIETFVFAGADVAATLEALREG